MKTAVMRRNSNVQWALRIERFTIPGWHKGPKITGSGGKLSFYPPGILYGSTISRGNRGQINELLRIDEKTIVDEKGSFPCS